MITHTEYVATPSGTYEATRSGLDLGKGVFVRAKLNGRYVTDLTEVIEFAVNL